MLIYRLQYTIIASSKVPSFVAFKLLKGKAERKEATTTPAREHARAPHRVACQNACKRNRTTRGSRVNHRAICLKTSTDLE